MKKLMIIAAVLAGTAGCNMSTVPEAKQEAYERWHHTRSQILYGLASEHFEVGQLDKAEGKLVEALAANQKHTHAHILLAKVYIEQGRHSQAVTELGRARQDMPDSAEVLYLLGVAQEKSGLLDDALISYRQSQSLDGANASSAITAAAEILVAQGKLRQAQLYVDSYVGAADEDPAIHELAGRLAMMREEYDKAAEHYRYAYDLDFTNLRYAEALCRAQFLSGQYAAALDSLIELTEAREPTPAAWMFTMMGDCYMELGKATRARKAHFRATEINPGDPGIWSNLAKATLAAGDPLRAIVAARQAMSLDPDSVDAHLLLGYAMLRDGQVAPALIHLRQAVIEHPKSAELHCVLGRVHAAVGSDELAEECYAEAVRVEPDNVLARELHGQTVIREFSKAN